MLDQWWLLYPANKYWQQNKEQPLKQLRPKWEHSPCSDHVCSTKARPQSSWPRKNMENAYCYPYIKIQKHKNIDILLTHS